MTIHSRTTKANGTTEWASADLVLSAEFNDEWNSFLNDYNGNIADANISATADIDPGKIGDYAASNAEFLTTFTLGDSYASAKPATLEEELGALRYQGKYAQFGQNLKSYNGTTTETLGWFEPRLAGGNLLFNHAFESQATGVVTSVDGWTLAGAPTLSIDAPAESSLGLEKRSLDISGSGVGISQVVSGLKASTKYRVGISYVRGTATGTFTFATVGADNTSNYRDFSHVDSTTVNVQEENYVIQTTAAAGDVTVTLTTSADPSAQVNAYFVWFYEMQDRAPTAELSVPTVVKDVATQATYSGTTVNVWDYSTISGLEHTAYVPANGYELEASVVLQGYLTSATSTDMEMKFALEMQIDGGGFSDVSVLAANESVVLVGATTIRSIHLQHVVPSAAAGSTYEFRVRVAIRPNAASGVDFVAHPLYQGEQSNSTAFYRLRRC